MTVSTHIVKRQSGYVAGWFTRAQADSGEAARFTAECNLTVPADPAELIELDPDGTAWDGLLGEALTCERTEPRPPGWGTGTVCGFPAQATPEGPRCEAHGGAW